MIFSANSLLSDDQAITASAASTNVIDLGANGTPVGGSAALGYGSGEGTPVPFLVQVTAAFDNLTSLTIAVETDDNSGFSSATKLVEQTIALAALVAGKQIALPCLPDQLERYVRVYYTVTGTNPANGTVKAGITMGRQTN